MRKHTEAAEVVLAGVDPAPNAVLAETLLGLARAWDHIETTQESFGIVPTLAAQILKTLEALEVDLTQGDIWDAVVDELQKPT